MPAGLGWHPFFTKCHAVRTDAACDWAMGADLLPTGLWQLPEKWAVTRYLSDWTWAELVLDSGLRVSIRASLALGHLVIHDPDGPYICVEPVSHLANSMNLYPERSGDNLVNLPCGASLEAKIDLAFG